MNDGIIKKSIKKDKTKQNKIKNENLALTMNKNKN